MDESSQKRRERLQAMRADASNQSQPLSSSSSSSPTQGLSNPLVNSDANERTPKAPRFHYYTDPMAAFSGSKASNHPESFSAPIRGRSPLSHPSNRPNVVGSSGFYRAPESFSSPIRSPSPHSYALNRPIDGPMNYNVAAASPPGLQFQTSQSPDQSPWRSPIPFQSPFPGNFRGTPPSHAPTPNSSRPNYSSRGGLLPNPSFRHGGSPSPHSNSGRGNQSRFRGGRGRGFRHINCSSPYDPHHFYKAMMKDPWRKLKPIVGILVPVPRNGSGSSWLPKSIAEPKRAGKAFETGGAKSKLSLAESLALALDEAASGEEET
ncbi:uncharacterized protein A4U43_C08F19230 [Asparagus officinalis]|uniref:DNA-directed RNA polymerase II subunit rpb1 isoform X2 n=1 Tax=Asparagus officinalis TaxID=4686 RepID=UPI00098E59D6|nr:DNA-directed RNA polymerase II subunit rpb1 isoform X2 [Asparagus officinalis]ONK60508.1 uncharacterized protein A4U43_C08F19230 [Asparagus officinalis]